MDLKEEMKQEGLKRLKILKEHHNLLNNVVKDFEKENIRYYTEDFNGMLCWLIKNNNCDDFVNIVEKVEKEKNVLVYHATHSFTEFGELLNLFVVSKYKEEWDFEKEDLKQGIAFCYVVNLDEELFSEFGSIGFKGKFGGITRIA